MIKYIQFAALCLIWSTTWAAIKLAADGTPPMVGLTLRYSFAVVALALMLLVRRQRVALDRHSLRLYLVVGLFSMGLSYFGTYWGLIHIPSSLSSILWAVFPLFVGVFAHLMLPSERLQPVRLAAILIATIGVILILSDRQIVFSREVLWGSLAVIAAVIVGAYPNVYVKKHPYPYDSMVLTTVSILIGAIVHAIAAWQFGQWPRMAWNLTNLACAAYLGLFGSAIAFSIYYSLIKKIEVVKLAFVTFLTPILALLIGWALLHETITLRELGGMGLIFVGLALYDWRKYWHYVKPLPHY